jgi:hypothetical protein
MSGSSSMTSPGNYVETDATDGTPEPVSLDDRTNKRAIDLVEFITRIDSLIARLELHPPGTQRERLIAALFDARAQADEFFGGTQVMSSGMATRMS